jgi:hypothetical protein
MTGATFGSGWTGSGDSGFDLAISGDGQAFTLTFAEFEADLDGGKSPDLFAARVFSAGGSRRCCTASSDSTSATGTGWHPLATISVS